MICLPMQQDWNSSMEYLELCLMHRALLHISSFYTTFSVLQSGSSTSLCFFQLFFSCCFHRLFSAWSAWGHWHRRCVRRRTALPLFVTMGQGSVKPASPGMMLQEQFSLPSWVVPGTRWWSALVVPYWTWRRAPSPTLHPRSIFSCIWS